MKKLLIFLILTYLLFTINSGTADQSLNENNSESEKILKVGVLLPLSGEFQDIGESFLKAIQLALYDISNEDIKIYPKDSKGNALNTYLSAKELEEMGVIVIPVLYDRNRSGLGGMIKGFLQNFFPIIKSILGYDIFFIAKYNRGNIENIKKDTEVKIQHIEERKKRWNEQIKDFPSPYQYLKNNIHNRI